MLNSLKNLEARITGKGLGQEKEIKINTFSKILESLTDFLSKLNGANKVIF